MTDPIVVKLDPLPPAEVRKAIDSVMGPVREAYDAAVAQAEAQVLDLLRDLSGAESEAAVLTLEVLEDARRRVEEGWVGNGAPHTIDEVARIVAGDLDAQDGPWVAFPTPRVLDFRLGPWAPCGECGRPTRAVTRAGDRHVHMLCFDTLDREYTARFDREADRDEEAFARGRTPCPTCLRVTYLPEEGRCMVPTCERAIVATSTFSGRQSILRSGRVMAAVYGRPTGEHGVWGIDPDSIKERP